MLEQLILEREFTDGPLSPNGDRIHFRPKSAARASWFYSPEQDVELCIVYENIIEIRGPKGTLNSIEMFLRWKLEE